MIVGIHQPNYLPYIGFFDKLKKSDIFILYDDAQFSKGDFHHRNKIRTPNGSKWLTVPVEKKLISINKIRIRNDLLIGNNKWNISHLGDIQNNYSKAPFYQKFITELENIYNEDYDFLVDLNMRLIQFLSDSFNIKTKIVCSSEFGFNSKSTSKILDLVDAVGGNKYLSGSCGKNYLEIEQFDRCGIELIFQDFKHPIYDQQYNGFMPNMTSLDALLNAGFMGDKYK
ncbi:WbqC family protein [Methanolobus mangrovi]|uniref:WbqC family protein n=1 Tax=Methanolobus mangrovi TaxID=3072977 RepID=A0AA51UHF8_9EURY|nr:WbqC family protein [Methanolobus mangrovi]WMW23241.1 WbqC family protein [Methanolobus mangrovi]